MNTTLSTILGFLVGVLLTVLGIYWFRACFDLLSALLDRDFSGCGVDLVIFGAGLCCAAGSIIVFMPDTLSTLALFSLYAGIVGGIALAGLGLYIRNKEKKKPSGAGGNP